MSKFIKSFDQATVDAMLADIKMSLAGVAQKYHVDLNIPDYLKPYQGSVDIPMQAVLIGSAPRGIAAPTLEDQIGSFEAGRIERFMAALHDAHALYFPHLSLKSHYRNGDHTYAIVGYNARAREHKLLMQNVESGEYSRMPIDAVSEFKRVRAKKA